MCLRRGEGEEEGRTWQKGGMGINGRCLTVGKKGKRGRLIEKKVVFGKGKRETERERNGRYTEGVKWEVL